MSFICTQPLFKANITGWLSTGNIMNWDAIGAVGELLGASAVLVTLIYLAVQIRQNTSAAATATYESTMTGFNDINIACFVAYKAETILHALESALSRGVLDSMLVESSEKHGGAITIDVVQAMREALPSARVLTWKKKTEQFEGGEIHAKVAVADYVNCFLSSANLTGHAMEKNMEARLLFTGGHVPKQLHEHLDSLVVTRFIQ